MPRRKTHTRKRKRRRYAKSRSVTATMGGAPLPTIFKTRLRYCEGVSMNPGAFATAVELFGANCLWDPNLNVGGHQPRGWDELIALYNHATVIGSKISCQFSNTDATNSQICGIALRPTTVSETDYNNYMEGSNVKYALLAPQGSGASNKTVTYTFNNKYLGVGNPMASSNLRNSASANPTEIAVYQPFVACQDGADGGKVDVLVTIEYVVVFTEPKPVLQS